MRIAVPAEAWCIYNALERVTKAFEKANPNRLLIGKEAVRLFSREYDCTVEYVAEPYMVPMVFFSEKAWTAFVLMFPPGPDEGVTIIDNAE
jgi:hypothetical protein